MSVNSFQEYNAYLRYMNSVVSIWGQPSSIFVPKQNVTLGYENLASSLESETGVSDIANLYSVYQYKVYIDFNPKKSVFYHFNYFPKEGEDPTIAFMPSNSVVRENSFIRTSACGQTSIWGDLIFEITHIEEDGVFQLLKRTYFLKQVSDRQLHRLLDTREVHYLNA